MTRPAADHPAVPTRTAGPAADHEAAPTSAAEPAAPPVRELLVLYDAGCRVCRAARRWLAGQPALVPLRFLPAGSTAALTALPDLDHAATLRDITVVADTGAVYTGDGAWLACLWALDGYRELAERLASPALLPLARKVVAAAAAVRRRSRDGYGYSDERDVCADRRC